MSTGDSAAALRWWRAPAKLNLCLHVVGRRADGYHELQTVFQLIDLCDLLAFEVDPTGGVTRVDDGAAAPGALAAVAPDTDLTVRAARALQAASGTSLGARIRRSSVCRRMGGDVAATTLRVLDRMWGTALGTDALAAIGLGLGADVPVFVRGRSAVGEGVGERLTPVDLPPRWFLVIHPQTPITEKRSMGKIAIIQVWPYRPARSSRRRNCAAIRRGCRSRSSWPGRATTTASRWCGRGSPRSPRRSIGWVATPRPASPAPAPASSRRSTAPPPPNGSPDGSRTVGGRG